MQFRLLGPLEVLHEGRPLALGGIKQRATLGLLLLKANQVVPISQLVGALWPGEDPPVSARKILQNAVWSLRAVLAATSGPDAPRLSTEAPGYVLRVDPEQVDLTRFHRRTEQARAEAANPEVAAGLLREALGAWRGSALADLVESGLSWPELAAVENARLDTLEDYFDLELACGRHQSVLSELESLVEAERLRERSCGQLMLALYRCGRQAEALAVYGRLRAALVDDLGLEPGPALRKLQGCILTQDPGLDPPARREVAPVTAIRPVAGDPVAEHPVERLRARRGPSGARRRDLSVALVRVRPSGCHGDSSEVDDALAAVTAMVRSGVRELGGVVATSIGSASLVLFCGGDSHEQDARRAVQAALALRDCFAEGAGLGVEVRVAVATGSALVRVGRAFGPSVDGALVERCQQLLTAEAQDAVWVCDRTRELVGEAFTSAPGSAPGVWRVDGTRAARSGEHDSELAVVRGLLDRVVRRDTPHLVTVFGEGDEFLDGFSRSVGTRVVDSRVLPGDRGPEVLARVVAALCGTAPGDREAVRAALASRCGRLCRTGRQAEQLTARVLRLFEPGGERVPVDAVDAWRRFTEAAAQERPLVVVLRDLHLAVRSVQDAVESLVDSPNPVPLLLVVSARPDLLERRPDWGGGKQHAASIALDPVRDGTVERLRRTMLSAAPVAGRRLFGGPLPRRAAWRPLQVPDEAVTARWGHDGERAPRTWAELPHGLPRMRDDRAPTGTEA
ncbi:MULTISPECIES: BTAD domain-containing putative transcriptional regulator [Actinosynnema]|uniref:BTAD domain-containing putative transcriptional regulator n=1 Tax=Actinosynnema TaxID=40566 RepID=UPI0020A26E85|nr:BTAD domain-containing putative transcriptional regulator [Actinosynnema pretiosum]MCP2094454.1 DNA-binding transcriptional activator of the SARP family [Actinosynnema pretiosum]